MKTTKFIQLQAPEAKRLKIRTVCITFSYISMSIGFGYSDPSFAWLCCALQIYVCVRVCVYVCMSELLSDYTT